jgi:hypothetical protein
MLDVKTTYIRWGLYLASFWVAYALAKATNNPDYLLAWMIGLIGFVNVEVMYILSRVPTTADTVQRLYSQCYWSCDHPICRLATSMRGEGYFLTPEGTTSPKKVRSCMLSLWGVLHFILFFLIGFVAPSIFPAIVLVSLVYEFAEYTLYNCHDAMDVVLNIMGYLFGMTLRRFL